MSMSFDSVLSFEPQVEKKCIINIYFFSEYIFIWTIISFNRRFTNEKVARHKAMPSCTYALKVQYAVCQGQTSFLIIIQMCGMSQTIVFDIIS